MNGIQRCHQCTADNLLFEMKKGIDPGKEGIQCLVSKSTEKEGDRD